MTVYRVEYRECPEGAVLVSSIINADDVEAAEVAAKREFTAIQANYGARQYQILDSDNAVVATHQSPDEPAIRH